MSEREPRRQAEISVRPIEEKIPSLLNPIKARTRTWTEILVLLDEFEARLRKLEGYDK